MFDYKTWYDALLKPAWTPPGSTIGLIWSILYPIIAISIIFVVYKYWKGEISRTVLIVFLSNLVFNLLFTPIQFGLKNLWLAAIDILLVLGTIIASMILAWPYFRLLSLAQIPYLIWVATATTLQLSITWMNRGR
ncbi:tryptophan-rich sensory protein [Candidatus Falkowbacteria bacterium]|nr:tryptophan-rich sensory protein [Candidatus Falkowbacteria bacterium]